MDANEYVQNVIEEIFTENFNYYFDHLPNPIEGKDEFWTNSKKLYHSLDEEQKEQLKYFTKLVMMDTVSSIFAKLDNVSSYAKQEGEFELKLNDKVISGDLQEYFFMQIEE